MEKIEIKDIDIQYRDDVLQGFKIGRKKYNYDFYITLIHCIDDTGGECPRGFCPSEEVSGPRFGSTVYKYCIDDNSLYLLWNIGPEETY